jgi:citrate lyase subunit beta/citryl-CoA lyase
VITARSWLFVPGNRPDRFDKACNAGADAVILDLEDAVLPEHKPGARETVAGWLSPGRSVYVRVNGPDTEWFRDDVTAALRPGLAGIVFPKAECRDHLELLSRILPPQVPVLPLVESARGIWNVMEIATGPGVRRLVFGSDDFRLDANVIGDGEELLYARSRVVLASRVAGLPPPVDGVTTDIDDGDILAEHVLRARRLGFGGKLCIHPRQVDPINRGFLPTAQEIAWARGVVAAAEASGEGAIRLDGKLVDRPVVERARKMLELVRP